MPSTTHSTTTPGLPIGTPLGAGTGIERRIKRWNVTQRVTEIAVLAAGAASTYYMISAGLSADMAWGGLLTGASTLLVATTYAGNRYLTSSPYPANDRSRELETILKKVEAVVTAAQPLPTRRRELQPLVKSVEKAFHIFLGQPCSHFNDLRGRHGSEAVVPIYVQYRKAVETLAWLNRPRIVRHQKAMEIGLECLTSYRKAMRSLAVNIEVLEPYGIPTDPAN